MKKLKPAKQTDREKLYHLGILKIHESFREPRWVLDADVWMWEAELRFDTRQEAEEIAAHWLDWVINGAS